MVYLTKFKFSKKIQIFYVLVEEEEEARPDSSDDDEEEEASLNSRGTRGGRRRGQASAGSLGVTRGRKWPRTTHPASWLVEVMGKWENKDTLPIDIAYHGVPGRPCSQCG